MPPSCALLTTDVYGSWGDTTLLEDRQSLPRHGYRASGLLPLIKALAAGTSRSASASSPESPAICSGGYVWVTSTATSSNPASESSASYSPLSSAPETHPNHSSTFRATPGGNSFFSPRSTTSETANRPPGVRTLKASPITCSFSVEKLITQLLITTSTCPSRRVTSSISPCKNSACSTPASAWFLRASSSIPTVMSRP